MTRAEAPFKEIRKRDGRIVPFEPNKITQAIFAAARAVGGDDYSLAEQLSGEVINFLKLNMLPGVVPTVEEIQDAVEKVLIEKGHARTAKAYILYRAGRTRIREARSELMDVVKDILLEKQGAEGEDREAVSPAEKMQRIALAASQKYYLTNLIPPEIADAHLNGRFHIHQLGYYSKTFDSLQLDPFLLLTRNFGPDRKMIFRDPAGMLVQIVATLRRCRNDIFGELAVPDFDRAMGRLLRSGGKKPGSQEITAALRIFFACLQALSSSGESSAFNFSFALGLDTTAEGMEFTKLLLQQLGERVVPGEEARFVFSLKRGTNMQEVDPGYPLYRLALQAARRGNILFALSESSPGLTDDAEPGYFSNGLRLMENRHGRAGGKGRGNIASITLNLPRLAVLAGEEELFFVELDRLMRLAVRQLLHRFEVLAALYCRDLPCIMGEGFYRGSESLSQEENIREALLNGMMTLCFCGLREAVRVLGGGEDPETGKHLFIRILEHMSRRVLSYAEEYKLNIALCGAFAERETKRFVQLDRQELGLIGGVTDREFYSNGFLLFPEDDGLAYKIELEGALHRFCAGGYASKAVLYPGLDAEAIMVFMEKLTTAGVGFLDLFPGQG